MNILLLDDRRVIHALDEELYVVLCTGVPPASEDEELACCDAHFYPPYYIEDEDDTYVACAKCLLRLAERRKPQPGPITMPLTAIANDFTPYDLWEALGYEIERAEAMTDRRCGT